MFNFYKFQYSNKYQKYYDPRAWPLTHYMPRPVQFPMIQSAGGQNQQRLEQQHDNEDRQSLTKPILIDNQESSLLETIEDGSKGQHDDSLTSRPMLKESTPASKLAQSER